MGYPPLVRLLTISLSSKREADVIRASEDMKRVILREYALDGLKVIGPVEDSPYKLNDNYRKILYMKHESYDILLKSEILPEAGDHPGSLPECVCAVRSDVTSCFGKTMREPFWPGIINMRGNKIKWQSDRLEPSEMRSLQNRANR